MRLWHSIWTRRGKDEDFQLAYLLPWQECPEGYQGMHCCNHWMSRDKEVWRRRYKLSSGDGGRKEGRSVAISATELNLRPG